MEETIKYLVWDKVSFTEGNTDVLDRSFNNKHTKEYTIDIILKLDCNKLVGKDALTEANKYLKPYEYELPIDLDLNFYDLKLYILKKDKLNIYLTIIGIDNNKLSESIIKDNIPDYNLFCRLCSYHICYFKDFDNQCSIQKIKDDIILRASDVNADLSDKIIDDPEFTQVRLFNYQRRTIKWMLDIENSNNDLEYSINDMIRFNKYYYDAIHRQLYEINKLKYISFKGALLADEVGLGKTYQSICLSLLNQQKHTNLFNEQKQLLQSRATLIICPNQLCNQWSREMTKTIKKEYNLKVVLLLTKTHHDKISYLDLLDADFIVASYNFLSNNSYFNGWFPESKTKPVTAIKSTTFPILDCKKKFSEIAKDVYNNPSKLLTEQPVINAINYHRIMCDEFHEIFIVSKYEHMKNILQLFSSTYKWCVSGTPFNKHDCLIQMLEFLTDYPDYLDDVLTRDSIYNHLKTKFLRRNTKQSIKDEFSLIPFKECVLWLKFSKTEMMIYNSYRMNHNLDKFSPLLRQLCCDPRIVDELKNELTKCSTPQEIEKTIVKHHEKEMNKSAYKVRYTEYRIEKIERNILIVEYKRYRKFLKQLGY